MFQEVRGLEDVRERDAAAEGAEAGLAVPGPGEDNVLAHDLGPGEGGADAGGGAGAQGHRGAGPGPQAGPEPRADEELQQEDRRPRRREVQEDNQEEEVRQDGRPGLQAAEVDQLRQGTETCT